jgi:hypothetical protein
MPRIRARDSFTAYVGDDFPRVPVVMAGGDMADVSDQVARDLVDIGLVDIIERADVRSTPEIKSKRGRNAKL